MPRYEVTATTLNVRSGPSVRYPVVAGLPRGRVVEVLDTSGDGYWMRVRHGKGREGWCAHKFLQRVVAPARRKGFPWMRIARAEIGVKEFPGAQENARIVEYLHSTNLGGPLHDHDETPWCSAFVNWCVERAGYEGTDSAWARSWLHWGTPVEEPVTGCVVVLSRGNPAAAGGHVGFLVGIRGETLELLGGNQSNEVRVSPYARDRLLGFRVPR